MAVLVAIAIPVFTNQLERSRESTDMANIRSAYGEMVTKVLEDGSTSFDATVKKQQKVDGWAFADGVEIGGVVVKDNFESIDDTVLSYDKDTGSIEIDGNAVSTSFVS